MKTAHLVSTLVLLAVVSPNLGFLLDDPADCQVSPWTPWSEPYSYGTMFRERQILRYPTGGGKPCPSDLLDTLEVEIQTNSHQVFTPFPMEVTSTIMIDNFLRPSEIGHKRGSNPNGNVRDLLLLVDGSGSINLNEFQTSLYELTTLLSVLCPVQDPFNQKYNRAALIEFSTKVHEVFDFDDHADTAHVMSAIKQLRFIGSNTCTGNAFNRAEEMFKTTKGARTYDPNVKREVLIITDGRSNCGGNATVAAKNLQSIADVYALVIGTPDARANVEIASYVTAPVSTHLFATPNYNDLSKLVKMVLNQLATHPNVHCMPFNP